MSDARPPQITLVGDSVCPPETYQTAMRLGELIARIGATLVTGGGGGVMEAACRGCRQAGGTTVGVLPSYELDDANPYCSIVIPTGIGFGRNVVTALSCDLVVAIGGDAATLSEICYAWMHGRPIFMLQGHGGWTDRFGDEGLDGRDSSTMIRCADLKELAGAIVETCRSLGLALRIP